MYLRNMKMTMTAKVQRYVKFCNVHTYSNDGRKGSKEETLTLGLSERHDAVSWMSVG